MIYAFFIFLLLAAASGTYFGIKQQRRYIGALDELDRMKEERQVIIDFLHRSADDIGEGANREKIYRRIVRATALSCGAMSACAYEKEPDGKLVVKASEGLFPPQTIAVGKQKNDQLRCIFIENALRRETVEPNEGLVGEVSVSGKGVLIKDATKDPRVIKHQDDSLKIRSFMVVPMIFRDQLSGVLAVANPISGKSFSETDFSLAKSLGEQCALALQNAEAVSALIMKNKLEFDLRLASSVQRYLLPEQVPQTPNMQFAVKYFPQQLIGGDFYDFFKLPNGKMGVVIGDVSGKGISAAILMALCQTKLRYIAMTGKSPAQTLKALNAEMVKAMRSDMFITIIYMIIDTDTGEAVFARAGHEPPLLAKSGAQTPAEPIKSSGMALGMVSEELFDDVIDDCRLKMDDGDVLVMYTDGLTEATNRQGVEFSEKNLAQTVSTLRSRNANDLNDEIIKSVERFMSPAKTYGDDLTLLTVKKI